ncbi:teichoic acid transporter [Gardnerella vaginalis]
MKTKVNSDKKSESVEENYSISNSVDMSKPDEELSIADISRKNSNPKWVALYVVVLLVAIIAPYWEGRTLAANNTNWVIDNFSVLSPAGVVFISWIVTVTLFTCLAMTVIEPKQWIWRIGLLVFLAFEQFIAGLCLLRLSFWYSTHVVYGASAALANAANLGIISAGFGVAAFAILFVGLLVVVPKKSRLNVFTRSWASFLMFYTVEVISILIVLFGGFLTAM